MSVPERRAMVERPGETLSVRRQCALLNLARSGVYRPGPVTGADDLAMMRRIDELHLKWPFYGSRRMTFELNQGHGINRKRVQRLMRVMGIEALGSAPRHQQGRARPQDLSLPAAWRQHHQAQSRLGQRHHLQSDGARLSVSGGDYRLGQPGGSGVALVEHDGYGLLHRGAR